LQAAVLASFIVAAAALITPSNVPTLTEQSTSYVFYKGHRETGVLGSRKSPWQQTIDVISQRPWFGSGFGTSPTGKEENGPGRYSSNTDTNREHGSSYLAILEWVGLLGILPFASLLFLLIRKITQVLTWIYHTRFADHPVVPVVLVLVGGIIHAGFEDWLFAVGYYLTIFFWTLAFVLFDLAPVPAAAEVPIHGWSVPNRVPAAAGIAAYYRQ
jgi:O-antigen ligase